MSANPKLTTIAHPTSMGEAKVTPQTEESSFGSVKVDINVSPPAEYAAVEVRAVCRPGNTNIALEDVTTGTQLVYDNGGDKWSGDVEIAEGSENTPYPLNTVSGATLLSSNDPMAEPQSYWEQSTPGKVVFKGTLASRSNDFRQTRGAACVTSRILGNWYSFDIDLNLPTPGNLLHIGPNTPLRASKIRCFASFVEWAPYGDRLKTIRSPLGNLRMASPTQPTVHALGFPEGCLLVFQERKGTVAKVIHAISSESLLHADVLDLDPARDVYVFTNLVRHPNRPHQGTAEIRLQVIS